MFQTECINAAALKNAISLSSCAAQGAACLSVCRDRASSTRILPPFERSISARAAHARRIRIRQFRFDRHQNQNTIVRNDRSRFPLTVLRWNAKNAGRAPPRTSSRFCSPGNGVRIASSGIFGISQRHLKRGFKP